VHGRGIGLLGINEEQKNTDYVIDYMHQLFAAPGSGEYAFQKIFTTGIPAGVYAHRPLMSELPKLKNTNVLFLYGTHDWMPISAAREVITKMSPDIRTHADTVPGSHHLYLDSTEVFNRKVVDFVNE